MAIARDASSHSTGSAVSSLTFSHTCASGALLVVGSRGATTDTLTGITYNGVALSLVKSFTNNRWHYLYILGNPASGAHNIVISFSGATDCIGWGQSYSGTGNALTPDSSALGSNTTTGTCTVTTTTVVDNSWLVGLVANDNGQALTAGANTSIIEQSGAGEAFLDSNSAQTPAGSHTITTTQTSGDNTQGMILSIAPPVIQNLTLTASVGTLALTGYAATLHHVRTLSALVGNFILTGLNATFTLKAWTRSSKPSTSYSTSSKPSTSFANSSKNSTSWSNTTKP